jgi:hypothetical protein
MKETVLRGGKRCTFEIHVGEPVQEITGARRAKLPRGANGPKL